MLGLIVSAVVWAIRLVLRSTTPQRTGRL
jgi:hypothetical protein